MAISYSQGYNNHRMNGRSLEIPVDAVVKQWLLLLRGAGFQRLPTTSTASQAVSAILRALRSLLSGGAQPREVILKQVSPLLQQAARFHTARDGVPIPQYIRGMTLLQQVIVSLMREAHTLTPEHRDQIDAFFHELAAASADCWMEELRRIQDANDRRDAELAQSLRREEGVRAALATSANDLRCILDSTVDGIVALDLHGRIRHINQSLCRLIERAPAQCLGQDIRECLLPALTSRSDDAEAFEARARDSYEHLEEEYRDEIWLNRPEPRVLSHYAGPIRDENGTLVGRIETFNDATEQRRVEQIRNEFLSIAAHEFKTPLTSLKGYAQLLDREVRRDPEGLSGDRVLTRLEAILQQIERIARLVDDLLEISRLQTGQLDLRPEVIDLNDVVGLVIRRFRSDSTMTPQHTIELRAVKHPLIGHWDSDRLEQVMLHLLRNAVKFSPQGGIILVRLGRKGDMATVSVSDQGIGIPPGESSNLFQPFARATNAPTANFGGFGLGLYSSRDIIERHGGEISVESQSGSGSTFTFTLPLRHRAARPEPDAVSG